MEYAGATYLKTVGTNSMIEGRRCSFVCKNYRPWKNSRPKCDAKVVFRLIRTEDELGPDTNRLVDYREHKDTCNFSDTNSALKRLLKPDIGVIKKNSKSQHNDDQIIIESLKSANESLDNLNNKLQSLLNQPQASDGVYNLGLDLSFENEYKHLINESKSSKEKSIKINLNDSSIIKSEMNNLVSKSSESFSIISSGNPRDLVEIEDDDCISID